MQHHPAPSECHLRHPPALWQQAADGRCLESVAQRDSDRLLPSAIRQTRAETLVETSLVLRNG